MSHDPKTAVQAYFGEQLSSARSLQTPKKITQDELADVVDGTRQNLGLIEQGKSWPSHDLMVALAVELDVPPAFFYPSYKIGHPPTESDILIDQMTKDAMLLDARDLKLAALVVRTLRENQTNQPLEDQEE